MSVEFVVVVPARYDSGRLPGKVLEEIAGKPMIQHVVENADRSGASAVYVATDHEAVFDAVAGFGGRPVMTDNAHQSGSDRIAETCQTLGLDDALLVVNVQGDEPMMPPGLIDQVARLLAANPAASMATLCTPLTGEEEFADPAVVKVVRDSAEQALYFSRAPIPWKRAESHSDLDRTGFSEARRHLGIYAYRSGYIQQFAARSPCSLEQLERLEQLRVLWHGDSIVCAEAEVVPPAGVDNADDLDRVRTLLAD